MGIGGVEYHGHTWELGPRKAKELLFTATQFTAEQAERYGMVNHVVPLDELRPFTMNMAAHIAQMHPFALAQAKRAVNQTQDTPRIQDRSAVGNDTRDTVSRLESLIDDNTR